jgi:hypothetical protein
VLKNIFSGFADVIRLIFKKFQKVQKKYKKIFTEHTF